MLKIKENRTESAAAANWRCAHLQWFVEGCRESTGMIWPLRYNVAF